MSTLFNVEEEDKKAYLDNLRSDFQAKLIFVWILAAPFLLLSLNEVLPVQDAMDKGNKTIIQGTVKEKRKSIDGEKNYLIVADRECHVDEALYNAVKPGEKIVHEQTSQGSLAIRTSSVGEVNEEIKEVPLTETDKENLKKAYSASMYTLLGSILGGILFSFTAWYNYRKNKKRADHLKEKSIDEIVVTGKNKYLFYYVLQSGNKKYFVNNAIYRSAKINQSVRIHAIPNSGIILKIE